MNNSHRFVLRTAALAVTAALLGACGTPDPHAIDYQSTGKVKDPQLAVPPDLSTAADERAALPPPGGEATYSGYERNAAPAVRKAPEIPAQVPGVHIERAGNQRWLVVANETPDQLWPVLRQFWQTQGFLLVVDDKAHHLMETDWLESRAKLDLGVIRNTLSKGIDNSYVAADRNKFRTRIETGPNGETRVFISQKGMHEALTNADQGLTQWQDRPNDPLLEAEYLQRLKQTLDAKSATPGAATAAVAPAAVPPPDVAGDPGAPAAAQDSAPAQIELSESFDAAWQAVGRALDRANFTVDDRDRTKGIYAVRYVDPSDLSSAKQGFWNQVFHGRIDKVAKQYRVNVRALTETTTRVAVVDDAGQVDTDPVARKIVGLINGQLR